jgi:hypothetical protein
MADTKISALTAASTPLAGTEVLPIVQSGATVKVSVANLTAGRDTAAGSLTATGTPTGSLGVSKWLTQFETPSIARSYICGPDASTYARWELYRSSSTTPVLGWSFAANGDYEVANGNVVIGTSGKGIDFSATPGTGTSELLSDYEEGTWTPGLLFDSSMVGSFTYTTQTGTYTKVGRLVTARFNLAWSARPSAGQILVLNLPFTAVNAANVQGFISAQGGITNIGTYTIIAGDGLTVSSYVPTQCSICTVASGGAFTDPLQQTALTSAAGSLAGEIIYEVS